MFGKSLYLFSLSLFFAQITSKFCPLSAKKIIQNWCKSFQVKSVMSTEKAPQILQQRLTLQLEHLNEFCGHSQWNYLAPFFCFSKLLTHLQALDQREMWKWRRNSRSLLRSCFWWFCNREFKALDEKNFRKNCWILRCFFEITVENLSKYFGERFSKLHRPGTWDKITVPSLVLIIGNFISLFLLLFKNYQQIQFVLYSHLCRVL
jgi:hypothetical protein